MDLRMRLFNQLEEKKKNSANQKFHYDKLHYKYITLKNDEAAAKLEV